MLLVFPFLAWLAAITSAVLLVAMWKLGELGGARLGALSAWFLVAAYLQFFSLAPIAGTAGLVCQTILAVYLLLCWRMTG